MTSEEEMEAELAVLQKKVEATFSYIQQVYDLAQKLGDSNNQSLFKRKVHCVDAMRAEHSTLVDRVAILEARLKPTGKITAFASWETVSDMVGYIMFALTRLNSKAASSGSPATTSVSSIKLQALEIPVFTGSLGEWGLFYEIFKTNVHDRGDLPKIHKLQYLLSKLSGRAASVCAGIPPSEENYDVIWNNLVEKYDDKRSLASHYLDVIFSYKPLKSEGSAQLGALVDKFGATVSALKALGLDNLGKIQSGQGSFSVCKLLGWSTQGYTVSS
ncbi:hypothetical protein WDU94_003683 [Cyamophila willieti]